MSDNTVYVAYGKQVDKSRMLITIREEEAGVVLTNLSVCKIVRVS
jgi:hypothetical protein